MDFGVLSKPDKDGRMTILPILSTVQSADDRLISLQIATSLSAASAPNQPGPHHADQKDSD
jgi:hypothetical protein